MIIISHRGNLYGKDVDRENTQEAIEEALAQGFDVEVDLWVVDGFLYLGHDKPQYAITISWLNNKSQHLWIHAKNIEAAEFLSDHAKNPLLHWFWHEEDAMTITNKGFIWSYPKIYVKDCIVVELNRVDLPSKVKGVCTDVPLLYRKSDKPW